MNKPFDILSDTEEKMIHLSDGCTIRTLNASAFGIEKPITLLLIAGWGSVDITWNDIVEENLKHFNLVYVETREKYSSVLIPHVKHDLDRLSKDIKEVIDGYGLNEAKLILYGSSWGAIIAAHGLAIKRFNPFLSVLLGPMIKLPMPFYSRNWFEIIPIPMFNLTKKIAKYWLFNERSASKEQNKRYSLVLERANFKKYKMVGKYVIRENFLPIYQKITGRTLIIVASRDKMHDIRESELIAKSISHCSFVDMGSVEDFDSHLVIHVIKEKVDRILIEQ